MQSVAEDVAHFAQTLDAKPIVIGHSFSGLIVQSMALGQEHQHFSGYAILCFSPPTGNGSIIRLLLQKGIIKFFRITRRYRYRRDLM